jgi:rare lipoprotein A (peptidoglycan hydrolase)
METSRISRSIKKGIILGSAAYALFFGAPEYLSGMQKRSDDAKYESVFSINPSYEDKCLDVFLDNERCKDIEIKRSNSNKIVLTRNIPAYLGHKPTIEALRKISDWDQTISTYAGQIEESDKVYIYERDGNTIIRASGEATFYKREDGFHTTAVGAPYHDNTLTIAANPALGWKIPGKVRITADNGNQLEVAVIDKGPYKKVNGKFVPHNTRIIDMSPEVASHLYKNFKERGVMPVSVEYLGQLTKEEVEGH